MYVGDMTLEQAQEWREHLIGQTITASTSFAQSAEYEQLTWDISDLERRIQELSA